MISSSEKSWVKSWKISERVFKICKDIDIKVDSSMIWGSEKVEGGNTTAEYEFFYMWSTQTKVDRLTITFVSVGFKTIPMFVEDMVCHVCLSSEFC